MHTSRLFIIEGAVTFGVAIIGLFLLPDYPLTTRWLTPEERQLAHDRIVRDTVGLEPSRGARAGFAQAIRDPRLYLFCLMQNMHLSACSFNNFFVSTCGATETVKICLTELIAYCGRQLRILSHHYSGFNLSTLPCLRSLRYLNRLDIRENQRANMAHHTLYGRRTCRLHNLLCHHECCRTIRCMFLVRIWSICSQLCYYRMGICDARTDGREEGSFVIDRQCGRERKLHLYCVLVPEERRPQVSYRNG
jgi:hypothetical protein